MRKFLLSVACLLFVQTVAQAKPYRVEVLIIEHKDRSEALQEEWPITVQLPNYSNALALVPQNTNANANFTLIAENALELTEAKKNIVTRTGSKVLLHQGWLQEIEDVEPQSVHLAGGAKYNQKNALEGIIKLSTARGLYLYADLVYTVPVQTFKSTDNTERIKFIPVTSNEQNIVLKEFTLNEKRKVKKDELVYLDHPLFGVLIKVREDQHE